MTLLGFNIGAAPAPAASAVDKSLDDMIKERRQTIKKDVSNKDRAVATSKAKRNAAIKAKRGMAPTAKATKMEVEVEIRKQSQKTKVAEAKKTLKQAGPPPRNNAEKNANRKKKQEAAKTLKQAGKNIPKGNGSQANKPKGPNDAAAAALGRPPSKKAVRAAVNAMQEKGFNIPQGMQMVISFAPAPGTAKVVAGVTAPNTNSQQKKKKNNRRNRGEKN